MLSPAVSPRSPAAGGKAGGGNSPTRPPMMNLESDDGSNDDGKKDDAPGSILCGQPSSLDSTSNQSVCGVWLPWFGSSQDQPTSSAEEAETIIESILTATVLPNYAERVLPQLEVLLDKHGIESVVYLPAKSGGQQQPVGKKCMIRSFMDQARVEFRVRSAGELKKMRFDWDDIEEMGAGKYADSTSVPGATSTTPNIRKSQQNCYMYIKIRDRGTVDLRFESKPLRDATLMGFKLLQVKRSGKLA